MKLSDFKKYENTPFSVEIKTRKKSVSSSQIGEVYNTVSGELISDNVSIIVSKAVDKEEFVKLFHKGIRKLFGLKGSDIKVLLYLIGNLEMNTGKSFFDRKECKEQTGYEKAWLYSSLARLCDKGFIARSDSPSYYWINPSVAFNGSRLQIQNIDDAEN